MGYGSKWQRVWDHCTNTRINQSSFLQVYGIPIKLHFSTDIPGWWLEWVGSRYSQGSGRVYCRGAIAAAIKAMVAWRGGVNIAPGGDVFCFWRRNEGSSNSCWQNPNTAGNNLCITWGCSDLKQKTCMCKEYSRKTGGPWSRKFEAACHTRFDSKTHQPTLFEKVKHGKELSIEGREGPTLTMEKQNGTDTVYEYRYVDTICMVGRWISFASFQASCYKEGIYWRGFLHRLA